MARWEGVLDAQIDLMTRLETDRLTRGLMRGFMESVYAKSFGGEPWGPPAHQMADVLGAGIFNADPVYIEPEMQDVWEAAAEHFLPEPLQREDLITPGGFLWLPRPAEVIDVKGFTNTYRAISWMQGDISIIVAEPGVEPTPENSRKVGGVILTLWHHTRDLDHIAPQMDRQLPPMLVPGHVMPWPYGEQMATSDDQKHSVVKPIQSLWRLLTQTITQVDRERPAKPFRKRWARALMPEKKVVIVRLRRPRRDPGEDHEPRAVNWSHRWLVGGHWRNQWYPSESRHKQVWISPYVKGPDDKPLDPVKLRVFELVR